MGNETTWTQVEPKKKKQRHSIVVVVQPDEIGIKYKQTVHANQNFKNYVMKSTKKNKVSIFINRLRDKTGYSYEITGELSNVLSTIWDLTQESMKQITYGRKSNSRELTGHWKQCNMFFNQEEFRFKEFEGRGENYYFELEKDEGLDLKSFKTNIKEIKKEKESNKTNDTKNFYSTFSGIPNFSQIINELQALDGYQLNLTIGNLLFYNKNFEREPFLNHKSNIFDIKEIGVTNDAILRTIHSNFINGENVQKLKSYLQEQNYKPVMTKSDVCMELYSKDETFYYQLNSKETISHVTKHQMSSYCFVGESFDMFFSINKKHHVKPKFKKFDTIDTMFRNMKSFDDDIDLPSGFFVDEIPLHHKECTIITGITFFEEEIYEIDGILVSIAKYQFRKNFRVEGKDDDEYKIQLKSMKNLQELNYQEAEVEMTKLFQLGCELKNKM